MNERAPRLIAGVLVLLLLIGLGVAIIPPYAANWRLESYLNDLAETPEAAKASPQVLRANVLAKAVSLGLPVRGDDIQVDSSAGNLHIDVLYIVHVNLIGYSIDLHFRPRAGV